MGHHPLSFSHCIDLSETRSYGSGHPHAVLDCANERPGAASSVNADAQTSAAICRLRWVQVFAIIIVLLMPIPSFLSRRSECGRSSNLVAIPSNGSTRAAVTF